ncbi:uncharacterized protein SPPG_02441 [Spizellomyces punctatus DAOM BR117]|uniref:UBC core domain-containing protein n=1 Tax=Spizellomyces punctatus (strain DAOM BR117) TaxID=645134 RepID=A0A0L0HM91_SPIPD|nr:uncharacterized protein SPPG_02441 [Spizellomyces punctatus DAOM BR117]KND01934.1 hypothetical protein SPPG_02441 [Spizellomyces punctatus DAOM BR117]|eukprot:XP_016609973.1 hypothetical protein SPPG_02441 [Spizellomyces punctatus DAOM BR117]
MSNAAQHALQRQLKELMKHPIPGFRVAMKDDNIFEWEVGIIGPFRTPYAGGYFLATLKFPQDFPFNPPTFTFNSPFFHPNVYPDGRLCISILHPPGDDPLSGESASERWNPTQSVESVLLSILSLLNDPNCSSPANVNAGVLYRKDRGAFEEIVRAQVEKSRGDIPGDLVMPTSEADFVIKPPPPTDDDENFWYEDDEEDEEDEDEDEDEHEEEDEDDDASV